MRWTHVAMLAGLTLATRASSTSDRAAHGFCRLVPFEGQNFTVCQATPGRQRLILVSRAPNGRIIRRFAALPFSAAQVGFAMNAGMFDERGVPVGLLVIDGVSRGELNRRVGSGNFATQPNGVFYGDSAGWHVATTDSYAGQPPARPSFATQSGPMLVIAGALNPHFSADGPSRYLRNGVSIDARGNAWFAISDAPVSFGRFARLFRDGLHCSDALYLDGAVSSLWDPAAGRLDNHAALGPIVVALRGSQ